MSVKISLAIPTLMMIASGLVPNLAFASEPEYWTYSEMAALHAEIAPEIAANCGSDPMCKHMYVRNLEGDIYRALELYRTHGLTITAINPAAHTIRVAYDTDVLSEGSTKQHVKDLYIVQTETGYFTPDYAYAIENELDEEMLHTRKLFIKNHVSNDDEWFPSGTELELSVPDFSVSDDMQKRLDVTYRMSFPNAVWAEPFDFSDCAKSLGEDMECRPVYSTRGFKYLPFPIEKVDPAEPAAEGVQDSTNSATDNELNNAGSYSAEVMPEGKSEAIDPVISQSEASIAESIKAPETGAATNNTDSSASDFEFPWWTIALFVGGALFIFWCFFLPIAHREDEIQENSRKSQKSVDKVSKVR